MNTRAVLFGSILALSFGTVHAEEWYVGLGAGVARVDELCDDAPRQFCDEDGGAARLVAGWRPNRYFALEGSFDFSGDYTAPGARAVGLDGDTGAFFIGLNAIGFVPLGSRVSLYGGVGGAFTYISTAVYDYDDRDGDDCAYQYDYYYDEWYYYCRDRGDNDYESDSSVALSAMAGLQIQIANHVLLRMQAQRYFNVDGGLAFGDRRAVDVATVNLLLSFGKSK
jgi:opacity protein-like surface antigen